AVFRGSDACVTPVLEPDEVVTDAQFQSRHRAIDTPVPVAPRFGRTPGRAGTVDLADSTGNVLAKAGVGADVIARLAVDRSNKNRTGLDWPPRFKNANKRHTSGERHEGHGPGRLRTVS